MGSAVTPKLSLATLVIPQGPLNGNIGVDRPFGVKDMEKTRNG
jgi:hypothetical protein